MVGCIENLEFPWDPGERLGFKPPIPQAKVYLIRFKV